jgi:small-conductance mechanosensitive channel
VTRWWERRHGEAGPSPDDTAALRGLKRRDTALSLVRTTVRYVAFGLALAFSFVQVSGFSRVTALAGASLIVVLIGFAGQRFLTDIIAGFLMFFEGWFSVGDTITVEPWSLSGVVEEMSLRSTTLRAVTGETIRVNNSAIYAARVLPKGVREVEIEMMATDGDDCRRVVEEVARIVPAGPTRFVRRPEVMEVEVLDDDLVRVLVHASVAHGREWLVENFLPDLLKERAPEGLIAHGPIVMFVDERATRRFARSLPGSRGRRPRTGAGSS